MARITTSITIDSDIKASAQEMLADFGLDLSTAVNIFLRQMLRERAIPFEIKQEIPNARTISALKEVEDMEKHPELYKSYSDVDELMEDLLK